MKSAPAFPVSLIDADLPMIPGVIVAHALETYRFPSVARISLALMDEMPVIELDRSQWSPILSTELLV